MASHDAILSELGLAPTWRLRERPGLSIAADPVVPEAETNAPAAPAPGAGARAKGPDNSGARIIRIASLDWNRFAPDVDACVACGLARTREKSVPGVGD